MGEEKEGEEIEGWLKERNIEVQMQERVREDAKIKMKQVQRDKDDKVIKIFKGEGEREKYDKNSKIQIEEMREGRYWEVEEKRRCRLGGLEEESWEHVVEVCKS